MLLKVWRRDIGAGLGTIGRDGGKSVVSALSEWDVSAGAIWRVKVGVW